MVHIEENKTRTSDLDVYDKLTFKSLLDFFQDAAGKHAFKLGLGYEETKAKNLFWVLAKTRVTKCNDIKPHQKIYIKTWPMEKGRLDFIRNYFIYDENEVCVAKGTSQWCVIDTESRKIMRTDNVNYPGKCIEEKIYEDKLKPIIPTNEDFVFKYRVGLKDLDHNKHMNNARYADLVMDALTLEEVSNVRDLQINYVKETYVADEITVYRKKDMGKIFISGFVCDKNCFNAVVI